MKRLLFLLLFSLSLSAYGQVVNFAKTLPATSLERGTDARLAYGQECDSL